jgi:hypothetical protein
MYGTQPDPQLHPPVLDKLMFASRLHEHADPAQRVQGIAALPPDSPVVAQLLAADPSADVRAAAAARCRDTAALAGGLQTEAEPAVRAALVAALAEALAADDARRATVLDDIADEDVLVDIALAAERASVRAAAAERVHTPGPLRRLHKGARDKDRGVARLARERLDAIETRTEGAAAAEAILREAEALLDDPGPIVTAAVELDKRWKALALGDDAERRTRWEDIGRRMQQRFDRELEAQRTRAQFERRLGGWLAELQPPESAAALPALRETLDAMRAEATANDNARAVARLAEAEQKIAQWERLAPVLAAAEALVKEAEELADATTADDAQLPTRWHALDIAGRTPALTRRFEAALLVIEKRRLAAVRAAEQEQGNARHALHTVLHEAEQALAAGQLQEARAAADRTRALKLNAGTLPKPTIQRLSRVVQQLVELERWQQFGQQTARMQLVERAEALPQQALAPTALAREVQQLRAEWKKLDEQVEGKQVVPKPMWERFDAACERAYAPAARHFAEQAALHKQARKQREEFIDAAAAHAPTLATEPRDWRAIERWLRDTESAWRDKALGSLEPGIWKKFDAKLKAALAPLHSELSAARAQAKKERETLIAEAESLAAKAGERDTPSRVKELQARWQANAKTLALQQRDERVLWDRFRGACNAVFDARKGSRKEEDARKSAQRRAFEALVEQAEQIGKSSDADEAEIKRRRHELQEQWKQAATEHGAPPGALEARFKAARSHVDDAVRGKARAAEAGAWQTLFAKERLCEELDAVAGDEAEPDPAVAQSVGERWSALAALPADWEQKIAGRRDAALAALPDIDERYYYGERIKKVAAERRDALLELELMLGIPSPPDLQPQRLAVQVKQLRSRFKRDAAGADSAQELLVNWCSLPGRVDERDRKRCDAIVRGLQHRKPGNP